MIYIPEERVKRSISIKTVLPILRQAYEDSADGQTYAGGRIIMPIRGEENTGQWLVANCLNAPYFGAKFSSAFPGNAHKGIPSTLSQTSIYSTETGELIAVVEANYLTALKTGGSAAIATELMARKDSSRLGIIGSGLQAFSQVLAIQEVRRLTEVHVYGLDSARLSDFIRRIEEIKNRPYSVIAAKSAEACVSASDILCTCTTSHTPVFDGAALMPGTHINAIGSYTPFMQEIDQKTVAKAARIMTEDVDGLWSVAGDILIPLENGVIGKDKVKGSIGDVLAGTIPGRVSDGEITLYESVGFCVLDIALALAVFQMLKSADER
jgi:Predicted ornithine cyclodeaminase, mu-crystallin homolog